VFVPFHLFAPIYPELNGGLFSCVYYRPHNHPNHEKNGLERKNPENKLLLKT
jgi:hypothetical protein